MPAPGPTTAIAPALCLLLHPRAPQINELEAIVGEFEGNNELLHTKL